MKHLIYKELKLSMHPICYVFVFAFPLLVLIPSYPLAVSLIYVVAGYPILFLGASKGQQTNDLLYSMLLPVRRKDIVLARLITVMLMQFTTLLLICALAPVHTVIVNAINAGAAEAGKQLIKEAGMSSKNLLSLCGVGLICFSVLDLIFFTIYYKNGKSIVLSSLLSILAFAILLMGGTVVPAYIDPFKTILSDSKYLWVEAIVLGVGLVVYALLHFVTYKIASKELEKVDF